MTELQHYLPIIKSGRAIPKSDRKRVLQLIKDVEWVFPSKEILEATVLEEELLATISPCRYCDGGQAFLTLRRDGIQCENCGYTITGFSDEEEAIIEWNLHDPADYPLEEEDPELSSVSIFQGVPEGRKLLRSHFARERNSAVVKAKKRLAASLRCECCDFDFASFYGEIGQGFIECHHRLPLSELRDESTVTDLADLALVCANCHRMLHRIKGQTLTIDELRGRLKSNGVFELGEFTLLGGAQS